MLFHKRYLNFLLLVTLLSACAGQATDVPTADVNAIMTQAVETFAAALYQTQTAQVTPVTDTPVPTFTLAPTIAPSAAPLQPLQPAQPVLIIPTVFLSPTPTGTRPTPTVDSASLASGCNNLYLVQDWTIPAGTVMLPGTAFTKTWKVANIGTCDWMFLYRLVLVSGDAMEGDPAGLGTIIKPNQWTKLSINLIAPNRPGTYSANWRLGTQNGTPFGSTLNVSIVVGTPTNTPEPPTATVTQTATVTSTATSSYPNP